MRSPVRGEIESESRTPPAFSITRIDPTFKSSVVNNTRFSPSARASSIVSFFPKFLGKFEHVTPMASDHWLESNSVARHGN